jgi:sugar lactone lactonase YvrE
MLPILLVVAAVPQTSSLPLPGGYRAEIRHQESSPTALTGFAAAGDDLYFAALGSVWRLDPQGGQHLLHQLPLGHDVGLIALPDSGTELLYTDLQADLLWHFDLASGARRSAPMPRNAFDVARTPGGALLAAANPAWPAPGARAGIWLIDGAGNHREIIQLDGPSGPLVFDAGGNLLYALQSSVFPTPPGGVRVLRFAAADVQRALAGGPPLQVGNAAAVLAGLDGAYDLACDDRGRLYVSDPQHGDVRRTQPAMLVLEAPPFLARPTPPNLRGVLQMQFVGGQAATFDAFQPERERLHVLISDWTVTSAIHTITTRRPDLASVPAGAAPPGPVTFLLGSAPAAAPSALCLSGSPPPVEFPALVLDGVPLWFALDPGSPLVCLPTLTGADGRASWPLRNPGGISGTIWAQTLTLAPGPPLQAGTAARLDLLLQR